MPELHDDRLIEWNMHVTESLGPYDVIIGRDILNFLKIDLRFSDEIIKWDGAEMPFEDWDAYKKEACRVADSDPVEDAAHRAKHILDAKYDKADIEKICEEQAELDKPQQSQLAASLHKCEALFDGQLVGWHGQEVKLELQEGAKPYHARAYNMPRCHMLTLKAEVEYLVKIGVLKKVNRSEWAAPTFIIPKKDGSVRFISDFREQNKRMLRKPYPIPNIQDMLLNLEGFQWATSLDLNVGCSGHNPTCTLRSRTPSWIARTSSLLRTIKFTFLCVHNTSVPNGVTQRWCILVNKDLNSPWHNPTHGLDSSPHVCVHANAVKLCSKQEAWPKERSASTQAQSGNHSLAQTMCRPGRPMQIRWP